eukprot:GAHX01000246.1.p1 GENE.GAHX01000246.1~~GAHX01000246.1.p1  ORF type:complete len:675 (-),score=162.80 GAHX01000246.1:35-2059(-)
MERSNKQSISPSSETRRSIRKSVGGKASSRPTSRVSRQLIVQFILGFTILILSIVIISLLKSNGTGSTIEQELAQEGYMAELIRNIKEGYPTNAPSSLFTVKQFNAQSITVLVTNTKNLKIKVKCSAIDRSENVTATDVWSASNSTSVIMGVPAKVTDADKSKDSTTTNSEKNVANSMTLIELFYPLNHSFVYCSAADPEIPEQLLDSMDAPLYKLNEVPLRLYLPIERNELGAILFSKSLHHEHPEVPKVENEGENKEEVKIEEETDKEIVLDADNNKDFIVKLLKRKYVSSSCSIFYAEDYDLPSSNTDNKVSTESTDSTDSKDDKDDKDANENKGAIVDETDDVSMDFSAYYIQRMNKPSHLYKRLFTCRTIVDSWKVNIFNQTITEGNNSEEMSNISSHMNELKHNFHKHNEFVKIINKLRLHENIIKLHHLYTSSKPLKISCALYTGAKEIKEQNLPPLDPETELFTFSNKQDHMDCSKYNTVNGTDSERDEHKMQRLMCLYYANSPILKAWYVPTLFVTNKTTTDEDNKEVKKEVKMSVDVAEKLALFSKYVHYIAMDGSVTEFDSVLKTIEGLTPEQSLVTFDNHGKINPSLDLVMFIAETVNRMKSPMSNTHSSMKIIKFDRMYGVLKGSIEMLNEVLKMDKDKVDVEWMEKLKGFIGKNKKYIEL